jgi:DNA repair exonuclease SbcCD nuclease subunit
MSTVLTIGDPHFQMSNMDEVKQFSKACLAHARATRPHRIVVLGDVLHDHERVHSTVLNVAVSFLNHLAEIAPTAVLVGNHDLINNSQFLTENHWMNALKSNTNLTVVDKVVHTVWNGKKVIMVPFVPPGRFAEALDGDEWEEEWPFVVTGHIHQNQTPQPNVYYPGSAIQVAFGESEMNVVAELDLNSLERSAVNEVDLGLTRKKILYTDSASLKKIAKTVEPGGKHANHKLKVCVDGTKEEFKALKKTAEFKRLQKKGVKIVYKRKRAAITAENMAVVQAVENQSGKGSSNFSEILCKIVAESSSQELKNAYKEII